MTEGQDKDHATSAKGRNRSLVRRLEVLKQKTKHVIPKPLWPSSRARDLQPGALVQARRAAGEAGSGAGAWRPVTFWVVLGGSQRGQISSEALS